MSANYRLRRFCLRLGLLMVAAGVLLCLPVSESVSVAQVKNAAVAFGFVVMVGVLLFDTFFYDRF